MCDLEKLEVVVVLFDSLFVVYDFFLKVNFFNMSINDCVYCVFYIMAFFICNSFVWKLVEIYQIVQEINSLIDYYFLGNVYYNMIYFGLVYEIMNYYCSGVFYDGFYDCWVVLSFYDKVMKYVQDFESVVQVCFMVVKVQ